MRRIEMKREKTSFEVIDSGLSIWIWFIWFRMIVDDYDDNDDEIFVIIQAGMQ